MCLVCERSKINKSITRKMWFNGSKCFKKAEITRCQGEESTTKALDDVWLEIRKH